MADGRADNELLKEKDELYSLTETAVSEILR